MNSLDLAYFRTEILNRLEALSEAGRFSAGSREIVELDQQSVGRLSRMDAIQNKAIADAAEQMRKQEAKSLLQALQRMKEEEFGFCVDCGQDIERARLEANPALVKCRDCALG